MSNVYLVVGETYTGKFVFSTEIIYLILHLNYDVNNTNGY